MANAAAGATGALSGAGTGAAIGSVVPGIGTAIGAIGGGLIGGLAGLFSGDGDDDAKAARDAALNELNRVGLPPDLTSPVAIKALQQAGLMTPVLIQQLPLNADQKNELVEDSKNKEQQQYAANALKQLSQTGLSEADRAAARELQNKVGADTQAKTNQILQQQQMRGQASGGATLAAQLAAAQNANQNESEQADKLAQQAQQARLAALSQFTNLSGQMRGTELAKQQYNMENELARQKFLDQNSLSRQQQNVQMQNAAQQSNLQRQQQVMDQNTQMQNAELYRQNQAKRDLFNDRLALAKAKSAAYTGEADALAKEAANKAGSNQSMITGALGSIGSIAGAFGGKTPAPVNATTAGQQAALNNYTLDPNQNALAGYAGRASGGVVGTNHGRVPTDSEADDKIPELLSPGEIVIPKSFAHDPDLSKAYINFIHKHKTKKK
jgi:hypothetical protein